MKENRNEDRQMDDIIQNEVWEVIVKYNGDIERVGTEVGAEVEILSANFAILTLPKENVDLLENYVEIEYIELPKIVTFQLQAESSVICKPTLYNSSYDLTGEGVLVGIIDSGIDYTHPDFRNEDGTTRILYVWDQAATSTTPPIGFRAGKEYTQVEINAALNSENPLSVIPRLDTNGHGTAVSGIAAGNGRASNGIEQGIAPMSSLIVVRLGNRGNESFARTTEIMRAIKYIVEKSREVGMPLVLNLSFGTNNGAHNGNSLFESYIDEMSEIWKSVFIVAAGNEGSVGHHFERTISQNETLEINFNVIPNLPSLYLSLWKDFVDDIIYEIIAPNGASTGLILTSDQTLTYIMEQTNLTVFNVQPNQYTEEQEIFCLFSPFDGTGVLDGIWKIKVIGNNIVNGKINVWLPTEEEVTKDTHFLHPSINITVTLPGTAQSPITVGGYNSILNSVAPFSGRGYTRTNVYVKPDLVAPSVGVLAPKMGGGYDSFTGTSAAAPFVTGACALIMQWGIINGNDPFLYGQRVKAFLRKGATRRNEIEYPNSTWGYGTLCVRETLDYLEKYTT